MARPGGWDSSDPGAQEYRVVVSHVGSCWNQERDRPDLFTSEPEVPQVEEGAASRASRHENAEALVFCFILLIFSSNIPF